MLKSGPKTSQPVGDRFAGSSSTQAIVQCEAGKVVYIQAIVDGAVPQTYYRAHTSFSGYRLPAFD